MLKNAILIITLLFITTSFVNAQKEQNNWFFGVKAALTWNTTRSFAAIPISITGVQGTQTTLTGIPTVIPNSPLSTGEGCFSLSDADGKLLFFSDGMTIWNRNLALMAGQTTTGQLTGNGSSAQSGIVLPYPNDVSRYIAVSLGERAQNNPAYSIVNMDLAGGLGQITSLNTPLTGQAGTMGESITAVRHANKTDFWIVGVGRGTTTYFNVWKVSATGVQTTRFGVASIGLDTSGGITNPGGYIKFSPDGTRFAWATYAFPNAIVYGNFNPSTGAISGLKYRQHPTTTYISRPYGVEFSPNSKYLYVTYVPGTKNTANYESKIEIYDVASLWAATSGNSLTPTRTFELPIGTSSVNDLFGAIQLGPDNRMYIGDFDFPSLFTLLNPDTPASATLYKLPNVLGTGIFQLGLPSFTAPWFRMIFTLPTNSACCSDVSTNFPLTIENGAGLIAVTRVVINFGDGGTNSQVTINNPIAGTVSYPYKYSKPGTYTITATAYDANSVVQLTQSATVTVNSCVIRVNPQVSVRSTN